MRLRQRRQRADDVPVVLGGAVGRFHAPDGEDDPALDVEFLFDRVEGRAPFAGLARALLGAVRGEAIEFT